jgi:hypothetical protein
MMNISDRRKSNNINYIIEPKLVSDIIGKSDIDPMYDTFEITDASSNEVDLVMGILTSSSDQVNNYSCILSIKKNEVIMCAPYHSAEFPKPYTYIPKVISIGSKKFHSKRMTFYKGYEGPIVHAFMHNDEFYVTSVKVMSVDNVFWRDTDQTYKKLIEDTGVNLKDYVMTYGNTSFIIHHPVMYHVTRKKVVEPVMVPIGVEEDHNVEGVVVNKRLNSVEEANAFLKYGWYDESVLPNFTLNHKYLPGEFVVVHYDGFSYRIHSEAYEWRRSIIGPNPNIFNRFWECTTDATLDRSRNAVFIPEEFISKYYIAPESYAPSPSLIVEAPESKSLIKSIRNYKTSKVNRDLLLRSIWISFLFAVPLTYVDDVMHYLDDYYRSTEELAYFILDFVEGKYNIDIEIEDRPHKIYRSTYKAFKEKYMKKIQGITRNVKLTANNATNQILSRMKIQRGEQLYTFHKAAMKLINKFEDL